MAAPWDGRRRAARSERQTIFSFDVVGTAEAAELLGVEKARLSKWRKLGVVLPDGRRVPFPSPVLELAATPLWRGRDIRRLRDAYNGSAR